MSCSGPTGASSRRTRKDVSTSIMSCTGSSPTSPGWTTMAQGLLSLSHLPGWSPGPERVGTARLYMKQGWSLLGATWSSEDSPARREAPGAKARRLGLLECRPPFVGRSSGTGSALRRSGISSGFTGAGEKGSAAGHRPAGPSSMPQRGNRIRRVQLPRERGRTLPLWIGHKSCETLIESGPILLCHRAINHSSLG